MILAAVVMTVAMGVPLNDEFFIISSVDVPHGRLVLKRPTEVTVLAGVTASTDIRDEQGERLRLTDLRSGDTVYAVTSTQRNGQIVVAKMRRGPMTIEELHRRYLH